MMLHAAAVVTFAQRFAIDSTPTHAATAFIRLRALCSPEA
jgi:hypothetical protein